MNSYRNFLVAIFVAGMVLLGYVVPGIAHHASTPFYDPETVVELQGSVTRFVFRNPHAFLFLDVEDENGDVTSWNISGSGPGAFRRVGISGRDVFVTGETYTATIALAKDGSDFGYIVSFILPDGRKIDLWHQYQSEG